VEGGKRERLKKVKGGDALRDMVGGDEGGR